MTARSSPSRRVSGLWVSEDRGRRRDGSAASLRRASLPEPRAASNVRRVFELTDDEVAWLAERLPAAKYTVDGVRKRLGPMAHAALHRNETAPAIRITDDGSALSTMIRLWLLQAPVSATAAEDAFGRDLLEALVDKGILHRYGDEVVALVDVRPYGSSGMPTPVGGSGPDGGAGAQGGLAAGALSHGTGVTGTGPLASGGDQDWWVLADLTPGLDGGPATVPPDHVLGVNSAAMTLAQLTVRRPAARALDLGTGCGVQALHLASHVEEIVGTDINRRALDMAAVTARLNGIRLDLREGYLFEPVAGERFDLIVSNPPFVITPRSELVYRDGGLSGDELCRRLVVDAPRHLNEGGVCQLLANWLHIRGEDWKDRLSSWLAGSGCDAWIVQREVSDPAEYVELWLKDAGLHGAPTYRERYDEWLEWFDAQLAVGVGFGWITLRKTSAQPVVRIEDWPHPVEQPLAAAIERWLADVDWLRENGDAKLWEARLRVAEGVEQEMIGEPGARHPSRIVLRQRHGMRRAVTVDTAEAGFVGGCDGEMTAGQIADAVAGLVGEDAATLRNRLHGRVTELITEGFLAPPAG